MNKIIQAKAVNMGLVLKDLFLLQYFKDQFLYTNTFTSSEINKDNPLLDTKDIKESLERLVDCELVEMIEEWNRGTFKISLIPDNIKTLYKIENVEIKKEKKKKEKKVTYLDNKPEVQNLLNFYGTMVFLPQFAKITERIVAIADEKIQKYSLDDIKDALIYANDQQWLRNKANENWCTFNWIMNKIDEFIPGGKYRKKETTQEQIIPVSKVSVIL